jgi:hypothetical protein
VVAGTPRILPARSQSAISIPLAARINECADPSVRLPLKLALRSPSVV